MTYSEKLRDPRWQKLRLEVMQRDDFACTDCGSTTKTLNVHHTGYVKGKQPWEYSESTLLTFCEDCHERMEDALYRIRVWVSFASSETAKDLANALWSLHPDICEESVQFMADSIRAIKKLTPAKPDKVVGGVAEKQEREKIEEPQEPAKPTQDGPYLSGNLWLDNIYRQLFEAIGRASAFTRTYLYESHPVSFEGGRLVIGFDPEFEDHIMLVDTPRNHALIQTKMAQIDRACACVAFVTSPRPKQEGK